MEFFGFKVSLLLGVAIAALYRVVRVQSTATTFWGKVFDKTFVFSLSIICGLILLNPIMTFFAIPVAYETLVAMMLALSSEIAMSKLLEIIKDFNLKRYLSNIFRK